MRFFEKKNLLPVLLGGLILGDICYSFFQHFHIALDGDMAAIILPAEWYWRVLEDPFGFSAVFGGEKYGAPNRYFAHWFMGFYFKNIPALLQHFVSPIDSIYLACALLKTGVQVLIGWLLAAFISGSGNPLRRDFLLAAVLVFPLFQNADYRGTMGIIDGAITYVCFFALPLGLLLLFFLPFFKALRTGRDLNMNFFKITIWAALAVVLAFNGPVVPPVVLIGSFLLLVYWSRKVDVEKEGVSRFQRLSAVFSLLPKQSIALLVFFSLLCLYSLYLGTPACRWVFSISFHFGWVCPCYWDSFCYMLLF
jgi:hypothetical protein